MAADNNQPETPQPARGAYGSIVREQGTKKVLIVAGVLLVAYLAFGAVRTHLNHQKKWPPLQPEPEGLTVVGLRDKDRPGWRHKYEAIERGKAWIFRRPDDAEMEDYSEPVGDELPSREGAVPNPGSTHSVAQGEIVDVAEIVANSPVVLLGRHFSGARKEQRIDAIRGEYYMVTLYLTDEGRSRYWQFSNLHADERLVFVLNGAALTCPRMDNVDVSALEIQPIWDRTDAEKLVSFIEGQKR